MKSNNDMYGAYMECLQCGYMLDVETEPQRKIRMWVEQKPQRGRKSKVA